jgi:ferredoxin
MSQIFTTDDWLARLTPWDAAWPAAFQQFHNRIPLVDQEALAIWFAMFPLDLHCLSPTPAQEKFLQLNGSWRLSGQEDSSHAFLYAHRWWGAAKKSLRARHPDFSAAKTLAEAIEATAAIIDSPAAHRLTLALLLLMTVRQTGPGFLETSNPFPVLSPESEEEILKRRCQGPRQSFLGKLLGKPQKHLLTFHATHAQSHFEALDGVEITTAAELDKRPYHLADPRCYEGMGPIPVDCRSGSCGTCWVGVIGGREHLDPAGEFERKRMDYFGYWDNSFAAADASHPRLRLACQAKVQGPVEIIVPAWNGVFGKSRRERMADATFES